MASCSHVSQESVRSSRSGSHESGNSGRPRFVVGLAVLASLALILLGARQFGFAFGKSGKTDSESDKTENDNVRVVQTSKPQSSSQIAEQPGQTDVQSPQLATPATESDATAPPAAPADQKGPEIAVPHSVESSDSVEKGAENSPHSEGSLSKKVLWGGLQLLALVSLAFGVLVLHRFWVEESAGTNLHSPKRGFFCSPRGKILLGILAVVGSVLGVLALVRTMLGKKMSKREQWRLKNDIVVDTTDLAPPAVNVLPGMKVKKITLVLKAESDKRPGWGIMWTYRNNSIFVKEVLSEYVNYFEHKAFSSALRDKNLIDEASWKRHGRVRDSWNQELAQCPDPTTGWKLLKLNGVDVPNVQSKDEFLAFWNDSALDPKFEGQKELEFDTNPTA